MAYCWRRTMFAVVTGSTIASPQRAGDQRDAPVSIGLAALDLDDAAVIADRNVLVAEATRALDEGEGVIVDRRSDGNVSRGKSAHRGNSLAPQRRLKGEDERAVRVVDVDAVVAVVGLDDVVAVSVILDDLGSDRSRLRLGEELRINAAVHLGEGHHLRCPLWLAHQSRGATRGRRRR